MVWVSLGARGAARCERPEGRERLRREGIGGARESCFFHGRTVYDLWNGVTEYYTSGAGAGKTVSHGERVANSFFGGASERKADFTRRLLKNPDGLNEMLEAGQRAVALLS